MSVSSPIHVEGADRLRKFLKGEVGKGQESKVNEVSGGTRINEGGGFNGLFSDK